MGDEPCDELSPRAEIFRSKLIEDFQLLDIINEKGTTEAPKYYSNEIMEDEVMYKLLKESPHALIKFQMYSKKEEQKFGDRRLNRLKNKNSIPLGPWAHTVVENPRIQNFMMFLIITNSVVLGMQAEISKVQDDSLYGLKLTLEIFDYCALTMFMLEIIVKWIDGFWVFWENGWNIFDFFVTVMSFVPEIIEFSSGKNTTEEVSVIGQNLRVFRILRSLKMVSRFAQLRIIVLTILKAFKSMVFILILLGLFMYIFAVAGTVMFDALEKSDRKDLRYKESFSSLGNALITVFQSDLFLSSLRNALLTVFQFDLFPSSLGNALLTVFQIFTLDHWFAILEDIVKVVNHITAKIYVILWICIGAFIFRNIFAGIMVMNFQNIRDDFNQQVLEQTQALEAQQMKHHLAEELERQEKMHTKTRRTSSMGASLFRSGDSTTQAQTAHLATLAELSESENDSDVNLVSGDAEREGGDDKTQEPTRLGSETHEQETDSLGKGMRKQIEETKNGASIKQDKDTENAKDDVTVTGKPEQGSDTRDFAETELGFKEKISLGQKEKKKDQKDEDKPTEKDKPTDKDKPTEKADSKTSTEQATTIDPLAVFGEMLAKLRKRKLSEEGSSSEKSDSSASGEDTQLHFGDVNKDEDKEFSSDWNQTVASNLTHLKNNLFETLWPRDSLFRYFQLMESLQENLAERQQLLQLTAQALARLHDTETKNG